MATFNEEKIPSVVGDSDPWSKVEVAAEKQCGGHAVRKGQNPNIMTRLVQQSHLMKERHSSELYATDRSPAVFVPSPMFSAGWCRTLHRSTGEAKA